MTRWHKEHISKQQDRSAVARSTVRWLLLAVCVSGALAMTAAAADQDNADYDYANVDLRVDLWLDREPGAIYRKGEEQSVGFMVNADAYVVVYRIDTEGLVDVLWPRSRLDDGFVFGGHEYLLPVTGDRKLHVTSAEGEGFVEAIVSRYPFDLRDVEIDFHHENTTDNYETYVAGDPFLAINEVNYLITGLEESTDFVITGNVHYYVHREVDHPRYLCNQCHVDDDVAYHPYRDTCKLDINVDYGWYNNWYDRYGYGPVYYNPVYVYVDPWTGYPWVNFWYDPWYRCPPLGGWVRPWPVYVWCYSPHYGGNCWTHTGGGHTRYRPLGNRPPDDGTRTKTREYDRVSPLVANGSPDADAGRTKTPRTIGNRDPRVAQRPQMAGSSAVRGAGYSGEARVEHSRGGVAGSVRAESQDGMRIRGSRTGNIRIRDGAGSSTRRDGKTPTLRHVRTGTSGTRREGDATRMSPAPDRRGEAAQRGTRSIKTVEPRKKGTRIWRSGGNTTGTSRDDRSVRDRTGSSRSSRSREAVKPRTSQSQGDASRQSPRAGDTRQQGKTRQQSSGGERSRGRSEVKPQQKSSGGRSTPQGSSGGSRGSSGGSRSGGSRGSSSGGRTAGSR